MVNAFLLRPLLLQSRRQIKPLILQCKCFVQNKTILLPPLLQLPLRIPLPKNLIRRPLLNSINRHCFSTSSIQIEGCLSLIFILLTRPQKSLLTLLPRRFQINHMSSSPVIIRNINLGFTTNHIHRINPLLHFFNLRILAPKHPIQQPIPQSRFLSRSQMPPRSRSQKNIIISLRQFRFQNQLMQNRPHRKRFQWLRDVK